MSAGADVHRFGGIQKKKGDISAAREVRYHEEYVDFPGEEVEDYDPLEEANEWGHDEEPVKWGKKRSTMIKGKGWGSGHKKGLPTCAKGHPVNKYRGQSPFSRKSKKGLGTPWRVVNERVESGLRKHH